MPGLKHDFDYLYNEDEAEMVQSALRLMGFYNLKDLFAGDC